MQEQIIQLLGDVNGFLWNNIIIALLIIAGVWFTATTRFVQLRQLPEMFRILNLVQEKKVKVTITFLHSKHSVLAWPLTWVLVTSLVSLSLLP